MKSQKNMAKMNNASIQRMTSQKLSINYSS